jgi:hypothetical protein
MGGGLHIVWKQEESRRLQLLREGCTGDDIWLNVFLGLAGVLFWDGEEKIVAALFQQLEQRRVHRQKIK